MKKLDRKQMAARVARDIPDGAYANLGIGLPTLVGDYLPKGREIILHSENGILGVGPKPAESEIDEDLINAGKEPITLLTGGAYFHHADSFGMIRGRHLDFAILGAFQVSTRGDLANWHTGGADAIPAVGGAMDLAVGAKKVLVMMEHLTKKGESKIVSKCTYPLTGIGCVKRVYSDLATLECTPAGLKLIDKVEGLEHARAAMPHAVIAHSADGQFDLTLVRDHRYPAYFAEIGHHGIRLTSICRTDCILILIF